jgi:2-desacetyl-2-hydroxyethyl bacteriochlorophyllide A dehydrogenase
MQGTMGGVRRKTIYFTAPRQVELREEPLPAPGADEVLVETVCSAISAGTEMLVYHGEFPHFKDADDKFSSELKYPCAFGYACVGRVRETGNKVDKELRDKLVFAFQPHTSAFIAQPSSLIFAPASLAGTMSFPAETCAFLPSMETAVNLIQDAAPILGERVLVIGQGVVGLLVASLLKEFPLETLVTADCFELRRKASLELGVNESFDPEVLSSEKSSSALSNAGSNLNSSTSATNKDSSGGSATSVLSTTHANPKLQPAYAQSKFDLTFELSGSPSALNDAIALTAFSGRIVIGSWYGEKRAEIDLGGAFHRSRIKMIASQVSTIAPELRGRWDKARRFGVAWQALRRIQPQKWITHRFPIEEAAQAYKLLDEKPQETIQVVFETKA